MSSDEGTTEEGVTTLAEMMQMMLKDGRKREFLRTGSEREEELHDEWEQREAQFIEEHHQLREQMVPLQKLVTEKATPILMDPANNKPTPKLSCLLETDDIESYLITFDRTMEAYEVDKVRWLCLLAPTAHRQGTASICKYDS